MLQRLPLTPPRSSERRVARNGSDGTRFEVPTHGTFDLSEVSANAGKSTSLANELDANKDPQLQAYAAIQPI